MLLYNDGYCLYGIMDQDLNYLNAICFSVLVGEISYVLNRNGYYLYGIVN